MTAIQLELNIQEELTRMRDDADLLSSVLDYMRSLVRGRQEKMAFREQLRSECDEALREAEAVRQGRAKPHTMEELYAELKNSVSSSVTVGKIMHRASLLALPKCSCVAVAELNY